MSHVLNRVGVDITGLAMGKLRCKNPVLRQSVDDTRRIAKHFNKPDAANKARLLGIKSPEGGGLLQQT